ncbi:hypothetical protein QJS10_CPB12g00495 [Acorus calamus]|uniref:Uncharacterized protein n=1 Tax=Acorus calamus TaxID=4465 RepID=A0AAV9DNC1_ACOCL|nr:hypothetical protein QJS10_CPB12g00495 [Acorus calamus]
MGDGGLIRSIDNHQPPPSLPVLDGHRPPPPDPQSPDLGSMSQANKEEDHFGTFQGVISRPIA